MSTVTAPRHHRPVGPAELQSIGETIAHVWYKDQVRHLRSTFFLYWRPARAGERIALPVISTEADASSLTEHTRGMRVSILWTESQAAREIARYLGTLPIFGADLDRHIVGLGSEG